MKPTFYHKFQMDYQVTSTTILGVLGIALGIYFFVDPAITYIAGIISIVIGVLGLIGAVARSKKIDHYFLEGVEAEAEVFNVKFHGKTGYIELEFTYNAEVFKVKYNIYTSTLLARIQKGSYLTVLFDEDNPSKFIIKSFYFRKTFQ